MTASRSDCSREPADEIPAVAADDDAGDIGDEAAAGSPKLRELLFPRPNMPSTTQTHCSKLPAALRFREAFYTAVKNPSVTFSPHHQFRINEWAIHNNVCALVTFPSSTLSHRETRYTYYV